MKNALVRLGAAALLALGPISCAVGTLVPERHSMPVARAGLRPEYRVFYDTLADYGDWVLIEPYGYVFRPRVTFNQWRPYGDGFWVPTDLYGWVWVSEEPFGWATYHYGQWFYDNYEGWVWFPGLEWAPAWVAWRATDDYVGWSPLMPRGASTSTIPAGAYSYVPASELAATNLKSKILTAAELGDRLAGARPIENLDERGGVEFNRGPSVDAIERMAGPLKRARLDDLVPALPVSTSSPAASRSSPPAETPAKGAANPAVALQRAAEKAVREARAIAQRGGTAPPRLSVVRPFGSARPAPDVKAAAPDAKQATPDAKPATSDAKKAAPRRQPAKGASAAPDSAR